MVMIWLYGKRLKGEEKPTRLSLGKQQLHYSIHTTLLAFLITPSLWSHIQIWLSLGTRSMMFSWQLSVSSRLTRGLANSQSASDFSVFLFISYLNTLHFLLFPMFLGPFVTNTSYEKSTLGFIEFMNYCMPF